MKTLKPNEAPYDGALSEVHKNQFSRLMEAARSLFFRRLNQFPSLRTDPTQKRRRNAYIAFLTIAMRQSVGEVDTRF
jgi:hypothetical protein